MPQRYKNRPYFATRPDLFKSNAIKYEKTIAYKDIKPARVSQQTPENLYVAFKVK